MGDQFDPSDLNDATKKAYCVHLADGATERRAAAVNRVTLADVRLAMKNDPQFALDVAAAQADAIGKVEDALRENALKGDTQAQRYFLNNRASEDWKERSTVDHAGQGSALAIEFKVEFTEALRGVNRGAIIDLVEDVEDAELVASDEQRALPPVVLARDAPPVPRQPRVVDEGSDGTDPVAPPTPPE